MNTMAKRIDTIARSPQVLAPLIDEQVELGHQAGVAFYKAAGALLLEARPSIRADRAWSKYIAARNITADQSKAWMRLARSEQLGLGHRSVEEAEQDPRTRSRAGTYHPRTAGRPTTDYQPAPSQETRATAARHAAFRAERRTQRAEMLLLISAGYKQLATKRHPDAGGSHDAMVLLKECRDLLLKYAEAWK